MVGEQVKVLTPSEGGASTPSPPPPQPPPLLASGPLQNTYLCKIGRK